MKIVQLPVGGFDDNFSYIVEENHHCAVVDPTGDPALLQKATAGYSVDMVLVTHFHPDHIENLKLFSKVPLYSYNNLHDGEVLDFGNSVIKAIFTPGHTADSVCYYIESEKVIFTGDTLFVDYIGFGNRAQLFSSLERLRSLPGDTVIYSGHNYGSAPARTVSAETVLNPFFRKQSYHDFCEIYKTLE